MARRGPSAVPAGGYHANVFVNCPFDEAYTKNLLRPLLFVIVYLKFIPRIAVERADSYENRLEKICELIGESRFSIHDVSRIKAFKVGEFARMNMPFELGIDYGSRRHGPAVMRDKKCLILEKTPHDFKIALSDLSGVDIKHHQNKPQEVVRAVRDWFLETVGLERPDPPNLIWYQFTEFATSLFESRRNSGLSEADVQEDIERMPVPEYLSYARDWTAKLSSSS